MNQTAKDWIAALRSGGYSQGTVVLHDKRDCFCVLGVLCDIKIKQEPDKYAWSDENFNEDGFRFIQPNEVPRISHPESPFLREVLDITNEYTLSRIYGIWHANDQEKLSFDELATKIEGILNA